MLTTKESLIFSYSLTSLGIIAAIIAFYYMYKIRKPTIRKRLQSIPDFDDRHIYVSSTYGMAFDLEKKLLAYDNGKKTTFISASELLTPTQDPYHVATRRNRNKHVVHLRTLSNKLPRIDLLFGDSNTADRCKNTILQITSNLSTPQKAAKKQREFSIKEQKTIATLKHLFWKHRIRREFLTKRNLSLIFLDAVDLAYRQFPIIHNEALYEHRNQSVLREALEFVFLVDTNADNQIGYTENTIRQNTSDRVILLKKAEFSNRKLNSMPTVSA